MSNRKASMPKRVLVMVLLLSIVLSLTGFATPLTAYADSDGQDPAPPIVEDEVVQDMQPLAPEEAEDAPVEDAPLADNEDLAPSEDVPSEDAPSDAEPAPEEIIAETEPSEQDASDEPMAAVSESAFSIVIINGKSFGPDVPMDIYGVEWDAEAATLTLNGATLTKWTQFTFSQSGTLKVVLKGANSITSAASALTVSGGDLVINADPGASLTVTAGAADNAFYTDTGSITINGGTYDLSSGYPAVCATSGLTVTGGANVKATNTGTSNAVYTGGSITVSGGARLEGKSPDSVAIYATQDLTVQGSGSEIVADSTASNAVYAGNNVKAADGAKLTAKSEKYPAVYAAANVEATGSGTVIDATSGESNAVYADAAIAVKDGAKMAGKSDSGIAIYAAGTLDVQNAEMTASSGSSIAINSDAAMTLDNATVTVDNAATGIYVDNKCPLTIKNSDVDVTASLNGITAYGGDITIEDSNVDVTATNGNPIAANEKDGTYGNLTITGASTNVTTNAKAPIYGNTVTISEATVAATATGGTAICANKDLTINEGADVTAKTSAQQSAIYSVGGNIKLDGKETKVDATSDLDAAIFARNGKITLNAQVKAKAGEGKDPIAARKSVSAGETSQLPSTLIEIGEDFSGDGYKPAAVVWKQGSDGTYYSDTVLVPEDTVLNEQGLLPDSYTPSISEIDGAAKPAATGVDINKTNFPDDAFRKYIEEFDINKDGKLSDDELAKVTELDVSYQPIESLKGIEYFTALTDLECNNTKLKELKLSENKALEYLDCSLCPYLVELDVGECAELTYLDCYNSSLTNLDVSKNAKLVDLDCCGNKLTSLNVSNNTDLEYLCCGSNQITNLDVSKNEKLGSLYCEFNQLTELDVSKNTALEDLYCFGNKLTTLDTSHNTALTDLISDHLLNAAMAEVEALHESDYPAVNWQRLNDALAAAKNIYNAEEEDFTQEYIDEAIRNLKAAINALSDNPDAPAHTHKWSDWKSDSKNHWKECSCGAITDKAAHTFGDWKTTKDATATQSGMKERTCSVCGYKESVTIPVTSEKAGWVKTDGKWYYYVDNKPVKNSWVLSKRGMWYFMDENGVMVTGVYDCKAVPGYYDEKTGKHDTTTVWPDGLYFFEIEGAAPGRAYGGKWVKDPVYGWVWANGVHNGRYAMVTWTTKTKDVAWEAKAYSKLIAG